MRHLWKSAKKETSKKMNLLHTCLGGSLWEKLGPGSMVTLSIYGPWPYTRPLGHFLPIQTFDLVNNTM